MKTAEKILELHFGSDYYLLEEKFFIDFIVSAMKEFAEQEVKKKSGN